MNFEILKIFPDFKNSINTIDISSETLTQIHLNEKNKQNVKLPQNMGNILQKKTKTISWTFCRFLLFSVFFWHLTIPSFLSNPHSEFTKNIDLLQEILKNLSSKIPYDLEISENLHSKKKNYSDSSLLAIYEMDGEMRENAFMRSDDQQQFSEFEEMGMFSFCRIMTKKSVEICWICKDFGDANDESYEDYEWENLANETKQKVPSVLDELRLRGGF